LLASTTSSSSLYSRASSLSCTARSQVQLKPVQLVLVQLELLASTRDGAARAVYCSLASTAARCSLASTARAGSSCTHERAASSSLFASSSRARASIAQAARSLAARASCTRERAAGTSTARAVRARVQLKLAVLASEQPELYSRASSSSCTVCMLVEKLSFHVCTYHTCRI